MSPKTPLRKLDGKPKPTLAATQQALVQAVRFEEKSANFAPQRLGIYRRLVRNNTFGFIDRCFTEAVNHIEPTQWLNVKEDFVQQGNAHSPYFQDIAGEFLKFCQQHQAFSAQVLALMDFEQTQLLAEVAIADVPASFEWDNHTVMQCSPAAFLREYDVNFIQSDFQQFVPEATQVLVWRNSDFAVYYHTLNDLDYWLLAFLQEQPRAFADVVSALRQEIGQNDEMEAVLYQCWEKWINNDAIYPANR